MKNIVVAIFLLSPFCVFANEFEEVLTAFATNEAREIASNADIIKAINEQNIKNNDLTEAQILALDVEWRSKIGEADAKIITEKLNSPIAQKLVEIQNKSEGTITEVFIMDNKGLNVAQSAITSDYWQGDEDKWQKTYLMGPNIYHISDVEEDESTQMFQSQVSHSITDPSTGKVIGAITIGINVEEL